MLSVAEQDWMLESAGGGDVVGFFAELGVTVPRRDGNVKVVCFSNMAAHNRDDRDPSCSVSSITGMWKCWGCGQHGNAFEAAQLLGHSKQSAAVLAKRYGLFLEVVKQDAPKLPGKKDLKRWNRSLRENKPVLYRLCDLKGWDPLVVLALGLGWDGERVTFPIRYCTSQALQLKLCGVVRYSPRLEPKMLAVPGTRRNLFPAPEWVRKGPVFLVEGEGTAVSLWSIGLPAVGIPGAKSWKREWARRFGSRRVVFLADCDEPGRSLAKQVGGDLPDAVMVDLDRSDSSGMDIGDWILEARDEGCLPQLRRVLLRLAA